MWELASGSGALGAGLAAASALTVTLYLLKVRRRRQPVVFLALWQKVLAESQRTAWWRNLRRLFSLLLQLFLLLLLFAAVANPRRKVDATDRSLVIVVDRSASMATADLDGKQTRYAAAQKAALALLARLGPRDRATVILADHHPRALGPIGSDTAELRRQLAAVGTPSETPLDVEATLRLASDLLLGQSQPTIALYTDGAFTFPPNLAWQQPAPADSPSTIDLHNVTLTTELFGKQKGNVGITAFAARRYRANLTAYEVLLELGSSFEEDKAVEIELLLDGQTVAVETISIEKGNRAQKLFTNLSGGGARLEARIKTPVDTLAVDDRAYATLPQPRPLRVLLVSSGNLFVEGALLLDKGLTVEKIAPTAYRDEQTKRFDAVVFDRFLPPTLPSTAALIVGPPTGAAASPFGGTRVVNSPIITEIDRKHPLMKWIDLKDLNIGAAVAFEAKPGDAVLARALRDPLMIAGTRGKQRYVAIGFDVQKSDWPLRVSFPVFMTNVLAWFTEISEAPDLAVRAGVSRRLQIEGAGDTVRLVAPDGTWRDLPVTEGRVQVAIEQSGFHELRIGTANGTNRTLTLPCSLLSPSETLTPFATSLVLEEKTLAAPGEGQDGLPIDLWPICVALALFLAAIEWWTYHRRVTV